MQNEKKVLAIIPARGGSKGVKNKNIRLLGDKPLIYWSISAAKKSKYITELYVSTDNADIKNISESYGANVLMRPSSLANDETPMAETLQFVCKELEKRGEFFDFVVLLQPTAPFRKSQHIDEAIEKFMSYQKTESLVSVYKVEDNHPSRMYRINEKECLIKIMDEPKSSLRQDLDDIYHRNGAIYICTTALIRNEGKLICKNPLSFVMMKKDSINIDDEQDLEIANFLMERNIKAL